jgi:hypothetical protein
MNIKLFIKGAALLGLLLLASCNNLFSPPDVSRGAGEGTLNITLGNGVEGARTLLPEASGIDHYKLTINPGNTEIEIDAGGSASVTLGEGTYTIIAEAFASDDETQAAARGTVEDIEVTAGQSTPVSIVLRALTSEGGTGTLAWSVSGDWDTVLLSGTAYFFAYRDENQGFNDQFNIQYIVGSDSSSGIVSDIPAGEYRLLVVLYNQDGKSITYTDVVHIAPGLTTHADYTVTAGDFGDFTTITGTVQYTKNGVRPVYGYQLVISRSQEGYDNPLGWANIDLSAGTYTLMIPKPDKDVTLYFHIDDYQDNIRHYVGSIDIAASASTASKNITFSRSTIPLSGTLTVNNYALAQDQNNGGYSFGNLYITDADTGRDLGYTYVTPLEASIAWTINIDQSASPRVVVIRFRTVVNGYEVERTTPNFSIPAGTTSLSGLNYTVDLAPLIRGNVNLSTGISGITNLTVAAYTEDSMNTLLGGPVPVTLTNGNFAIPVNNLSYTGNFYLRFSADVAGGPISKDIHDFDNNAFNGSDIYIYTYLNIVSQITVSGTFSIQVNSGPYNGGVGIELYDSQERVRHSLWVPVSDGNCSWSTYMHGYFPPRQLELSIFLNDAVVHRETIEVGDVDYTAPHRALSVNIIRVSGSVYVTKNGVPLANDLQVEILEETAPGQYNQIVDSNFTLFDGNGSFFVGVPAQNPAKTLQLRIYDRSVSYTALYSADITVGSSDYTVPQINLQFTTSLSHGIVTRNGSPVTSSLDLYIIDRSISSGDDLVTAVPLARGSVDPSGNYNLEALSSVTHGYVIILDISTMTAYVTTSEVQPPFNQNFELNNMTSFLLN